MCPVTEGLVSDSMGGLGEWDRAGFELCGESGSGPGPCEPCDFCSGISASLVTSWARCWEVTKAVLSIQSVSYYTLPHPHPSTCS